jgi:hypothetical protein
MSDNPYLRLISGNEKITIPACKGGAKVNIFHAKETFPRYIDPDFNNYGINLPQPVTKETKVKVYEMYNQSGNFKNLFNSLNQDLKSLAFESQEQILKFCSQNKQWLKADRYGTFFLFTEKVRNEKKFFLAYVYFFGLQVIVFHLSSDEVWNATSARRIVVPITKKLESKS